MVAPPSKRVVPAPQRMPPSLIVGRMIRRLAGCMGDLACVCVV